MKHFKITLNGYTIIRSLLGDEALYRFLPLIEDYSSGYVYDPDDLSLYRVTDGMIVARYGDVFARVGDDVFQIQND